MAPFLLVGCATGTHNKPGPQDDTGSIESTDTGSIESTDTGTDTDPPEEEIPGSLVGSLNEADGSPAVGVTMTLCSTFCISSLTNENGEFSFAETTVGVHVLENAPLDGDESDDGAALAANTPRVFDLIKIDSGQAVTIDRPMVLRKTTQTFEGLSGEVDLNFDSGLRVRFDAGAIGISGNPLPYPATEVTLGTLLLPEADWPTVGLNGWTIHAAWSMAVWEMKIEDGFQVDVTLSEPLPPATEVGFLVADYTHGFLYGELFEEAATLSADGLTVSTNNGLDRSTIWMVVTR
jgi:hypothetical protein